MTSQLSVPPIDTRREVVGWATIASGAIGLLAFGFLIAFLATRLSGGTEEAAIPLIRIHDVGVILQSLLIIPVVLTLGGIVSRPAIGSGRMSATLGVTALLLIVLFLSLIFVKLVSDDLYMIPQGLLGIWLIVESRRVAGEFPRGITLLGMVSGAGLLLTAAFPIGFALFVDPAHLNGWTPYDYQPPAGTDTPNAIIHIVLIIGTFMGAATYPIWAVLFGRRLLVPAV